MISSKGWSVVAHVAPIQDIIQHDLTEECICGPKIEEYEYGFVYIHSSLDNREAYEEGLVNDGA